MRTHPNGRAHSKQACEECGTAVEPIFKEDPQSAETWHWKECDTCWNIVCENCADTDETTGITICITCLTEQVWRSKHDKL